MTIKKKHTIKKMEVQEAPLLDENIQTLYSHKLESRFLTLGNSAGTTATLVPFQSQEFGRINIELDSSASFIDVTVATAESYNTLVHFNCGFCHSGNAIFIGTTLQDFTQTSITIRVMTVATSVNISNVATAGTLFYQIVGSNP